MSRRKIDSSSERVIEYLLNRRQHKINFVTPKEWMNKSLDTVALDFAICCILKRRLQKRKLYILADLRWTEKIEKIVIKTIIVMNKGI